jgi:hypothetical protein
MMAALPENPAAGPVDSLEMRWIVPGQLPSAVREWFERFPAGTETRQDAYLVQPRLRGLSVKLRDVRALDVKSYLGSPGILDLPGGGRGRLESWRKWSFPTGLPGRSGADPPGWVVVGKSRRGSWFSLAGRQDPTRVRPSAGPAGCMVELTEVWVRGEAWWTVGFEATGAERLLRGAVEHAAGLVFAQALPPGVQFSPDNSQSYAHWLGQRPA